MKKLLKYQLILLGFLLFHISTFSQVLIKENIQWSVAEFASEGNDIRTSHYKISGDTIVDNLDYKTYYKSRTNPPVWNIKSGWLLREENGAVYSRVNDEITLLLYDFSLEPKDTFYSDYYNFPYILDTIVPIEIKGKYLNHYYLSRIDGSHEVIWIEKIGSYFGLLFPIGVSGADLELLCAYENGELLYQNPDYNTCHLVKTDKKSLTTKAQFILLTSMNKGTVQIRNETGIKGKIRFFDVNGKQVFHSPLNASNIQLCLPQSGLIFYRFETDGGEIQSGKIIVE